MSLWTSGSEALAAEVMQTRTTLVMIVCEVQLERRGTCCNWICNRVWCALHAGTYRMLVKKYTPGAVRVQEMWLRFKIKVTPIC